MAALYLRCAGGGGTDIESSGGRLTGSIVDSKGLIARNTRVQLISQTRTPFSKDTIYSSEVNDSGKYLFTNVDTGMYNLEALSLSNGTRLLLREIHIVATQETKIAPGALQGTGTIIIFCDSQVLQEIHLFSFQEQVFKRSNYHQPTRYELIQCLQVLSLQYFMLNLPEITSRA